VRLPFFYGWVIVAVAFVTMALGVNARTAFSLLFPPILDEFGWERGVTAGAFSFGFVASALFGPLLGRLMDRRGPRLVVLMGVGLVAAGLALAPLGHRPWHLYATLGVMVGGGSVCLGYTGHALFLPNWFVRRRGLAMGLAFSGVGVGSILILPWMQGLIVRAGWRAGMLGYGLASVFGAIPAEIFQGRRYGTIFGTLSLASIIGGALGPWVAGALHDRTGSYALAFTIAIGASAVSAVAIWLAAPRKVRAVAGRVHRIPARAVSGST
jgi:MFS family permease